MWEQMQLQATAFAFKGTSGADLYTAAATRNTLQLIAVLAVAKACTYAALDQCETLLPSGVSRVTHLCTL